MELCHTTLEKYIRHREKQLLPIDPIFNELVFECLLSAVEFLHGHSVRRRNLPEYNLIKAFRLFIGILSLRIFLLRNFLIENQSSCWEISD